MSKSRRRNMRQVCSSAGNSATQGPHQVAQKLTSSTLPVGLVRNFLRSSAVTISRLTGSASNFFVSASWESIFDFHLVEQPNDGVCVHGYRLSRQHGVQGQARVLDLHQRFALRVIDAPLVLQLAFFVEDEDVRRGLRAVGLGHRLRLAIVEVGEIEMAVFGADFHLFQAVAHVGVAQLGELDGLGVVGIDAHEVHAFAAVVRRPASSCGLRRAARWGSGCRGTSPPGWASGTRRACAPCRRYRGARNPGPASRSPGWGAHC